MSGIKSTMPALGPNALAELVECSEGLLATCDVEGRFTFLNASWEDVFLCPRTVLLSRPFIEFVHLEDQPETLREFQRFLRTGETIRLENRCRAADGSYKTLQWTWSQGQDQCIYFSAIDLTATTAALVEQEAVLKGLKEHSIFALTDRRGYITEVNEEFCRVSGFSREELIGRTHAVVNSGTHTPGFFQDMWRTISRGEVWRGEICNRRKSGAPYWVDTTIFPLRSRDGRIERYMAIRHEITERKLILDPVAQGAQLFSQATSATGVGAWSLSVDSQQVYWDDQTRKIHEIPDDHLPDLSSAINFYAPEARPIIAQAINKAVLDGTPWELELPFITAKGRHIWVRALGRALYEGDKAVQLVGGFEEITVRKEHELILESMRSRATEAAVVKSNFLANMSHEIRTPLHGILGMSQVLARTELTDRQRFFLDTIRKSGEHLVALVNDILDLSKIENGTMQIRPEPIDLRVLAESLRQRIELIAIERELELTISNAIKFTAAGGEVSLEVVKVDDEILFTIQDTGIGIAADQLDRVFERFVQLDSQMHRRTEGSGLGLSIVRELSGLIQGEVGIESELGKGSRAWLRIPLHLAADSVSKVVGMSDWGRRHIPVETGQITNNRLGTGKTAIIVDDNATNRLVCSALLEHHGFATVAFDSYEAASAHMTDNIPDIIFMDLHMPGISGDQCIAQIRRLDTPLNAVPIIVVSADVSESAQRLSELAGASAFLPKPYTTEKLLGVCSALLSGTGRGSGKQPYIEIGDMRTAGDF